MEPPPEPRAGRTKLPSELPIGWEAAGEPSGRRGLCVCVAYGASRAAPGGPRAAAAAARVDKGPSSEDLAVEAS